MKNICKLSLLFVLTLLCSACSRIGDIKVLQYKVIAANPESSRKLNFILSVQVSNNGPALDFDEMEGDLLSRDRLLCTFRAKPFRVAGSTVEWMNFEGDLFIEENVSLLTLLNLVQNFNLDDYSVNYMTKVRLGAISKRISGNGIPLNKFMGDKKL